MQIDFSDLEWLHGMGKKERLVHTAIGQLLSSPFATNMFFLFRLHRNLIATQANSICIHFWRKSINKLVSHACAVGAHARASADCLQEYFGI